jgi:hypothetical protein
MDLSKILAIGGKPGLYKLLTTSKTGVVVESLIDGKRFTVFKQYDISSLEEISIYTDLEDVPLKDVLKNVYDYAKGQEVPTGKKDGVDLRTFFAEVLPNYDRENVYLSHIKKVIQWYNLLLKTGMMKFEEEKTEKEEKAEESKSDKGETEE